MKNFFTLLFLLIWITTSWSQIYIEDFSAQNGKGAVGPNPPTIDLTGVNWNIDISSATLSANTDWFQVQNEIFEAQDLDGDAFWISPSINISGASSVEFSLDASESGTLETADELETEYRINGGAWVQAANNGFLNDDFGSAVVSQTGLSGNTLEIRVRMINNAGGEFLRIDNVTVTEEITTPEVGFDNPTSSETETNMTQTVSIPVTAANFSTNFTLSVAVTGGSAEMGDYTLNTASLSFTSNGTQNISLDINDDADFDDETIEITLTESTSTGVTITTAVHTVTVTDDESAPTPDVLITEVGDPSDNTSRRMVEICNRGATAVDITGWSLQGDFNGNTNVDFTVNVTGSVTLNAGECYVFANNNFVSSGGDLSTCIGSTLSGNINTNGDETFWLNDGSNQIDIYDGQSLNFADEIATRNNTVTGPNASFTSSEWTTASGTAADLTPCVDGLSLPIELLAFDAQVTGQQVTLSWQTASEINNDYMAVERSIDGQNFVQIGQVDGVGNTTEPQSYQFIDEQPSPGINYYRLRQVDFDGRMEYHKVVSVDLGITVDNFQILPNPVTNATTLKIGEAFEKDTQVRIYDLTGRNLFDTKWRAGDAQMELNLSWLTNGSYILRLENEVRTITKRFVKQ